MSPPWEFTTGTTRPFGPLTATIRSEVALATQAGVGFRVNDGAELAAQGLRLLADSDLRCDIEKRARALIAANRGASARYAVAIAELVGVPSDTSSEAQETLPPILLPPPSENATQEFPNTRQLEFPNTNHPELPTSNTDSPEGEAR
jgi:hypothetical protein